MFIVVAVSVAAYNSEYDDLNFQGNDIYNVSNVNGSAINAATGDFSGTLDSLTLNTGFGDNELYDMNQHVQTTNSVTFASVNTGQGANELYDMDQNVLSTSSVSFNDIDIVSGEKFCLDGATCSHYVFYNGTHTVIV